MNKKSVFIAGAVIFAAGTLVAAPPPRYDRNRGPQQVAPARPQPRKPQVAPARPQPRKPQVAPARPQPRKPQVAPRPHYRKPQPPPPPPRKHKHHHKPRYTFGGGLFNPLNWIF